LSSYDRQRKFASWFFQILHNLTIDYLRRKRPAIVSLDELQETGGLPIAAHDMDSPEAQAEKEALADALDKALGRIRPEYREAVILRYHEELSVEEIAEAMGVPDGTVKTYLFRARKELASILTAQGWAAAGTENG